jgi:hypothetical protein
MATLDELLAAMNKMAAEQEKTNRRLSEVVNNTRSDSSPPSTMPASEAVRSDPMDSASIELLKEELQNQSAILRSKQTELNQAILDKDEEKIFALRAQISEQQKLQDQSQRTLENYQDMEAFGKDFATSIADAAKGMMSGNINLKSIGGTIKGLAEKGKDLFDLSNLEEFDFADLSAKFMDMANGIAEIVIKLNMEFYQAIVDLAVEFEKAEIEVRKLTGASAEFAKDMRGVRADVIMTGASVDDLAKAQIDLAKGFTDFTMTGKESRQELLKVTTVLDKLGFPAETAAKGIQDLTKGLGMSTSAAASTMIEFEALGKDIGVSAGQMASDFEQVSDKVLMLGDLGPQAFKDMARTAKITGLEIGKLQKMTDKFDTFEGAAEQAGKLNAALGGNFVNAMDLMMTEDPTERFEMIRNSILDAGMSFEEMSYRQKQFYTEAMGLENVTDLSKALSGDLDSLNGSLGENAATQEAAAKRAEELQTFQESLKNLLQSMIPVFSPLIDMLQGMAKFLQENAFAIKIVVGALLMLGGVVATIASGGTLGLPLLAGILTTITGGMITFGDAGTSTTGILKKLGPVGEMLSDSFGTLSEAFMTAWEAGQPLRDVLMFIAEIVFDVFVMNLKMILGYVAVLIAGVMDLISVFVNFGAFITRLVNVPFKNMMILFESIGEAFETGTIDPILDGMAQMAANVMLVFEPLIEIIDIFINGLMRIPKLLGELAGFDMSGFSVDLSGGFANFVQGMVPMAEGGVVTGPTPALVGEAGPEAIIPLDQLATVAMSVIAAPMAAPAKAIQTMINNTTTNKQQTGPQQMVVNLTLDGKIIDKKVIDIVNKKALDSLVGL